MAYWHYSGRVTTPINVPGRGPIVLRPREKFHAPQSAVAHLLRLNPPLVKRLPDPPPSAAEQSRVEPKQAEKETAPAAADPKSEAPNPASAAQPVEADVVVSAAHVEAEQTGAVVQSASDSTVEEVSEGEDTSSVSEESESRPQKRRRRPDR
jgi:hypothetical protein